MPLVESGLSPLRISEVNRPPRAPSRPPPPSFLVRADDLTIFLIRAASIAASSCLVRPPSLRREAAACAAAAAFIFASISGVIFWFSGALGAERGVVSTGASDGPGFAARRSLMASPVTAPAPCFLMRPPFFMPPTCLMPSRSSFADLASRLIRLLADRSRFPPWRGLRPMFISALAPTTLPPFLKARRLIGRIPVLASA